MDAPDTNLLLYANDPPSSFFEQAKLYLEDCLNGSEPFGLPLLSVQGFIRISTGVPFGGSRITTARAFEIVDSWLARPHVRLLYPGPSHLQILKDLSMSAQISGSSISDAAIAAIAIEHNAVLTSADRGFARFPGLRWHNPLA